MTIKTPAPGEGGETLIEQALRPFWVSWWRDLSVGFELHSPWWVSGCRFLGEDMLEQDSICAAVMATDELGAQRVVTGAHDREPHHLDFRFVEERPAYWTPFNGRFQRANWMKWPPALARAEGGS